MWKLAKCKKQFCDCEVFGKTILYVPLVEARIELFLGFENILTFYLITVRPFTSFRLF